MSTKVAFFLALALEAALGLAVQAEPESVDPSEAVACVVGETPAYYRTLDDLFAAVKGRPADVVVLKSCGLSNEVVAVAGETTLSGSEAGLSVAVGGNSGFAVADGASLVVSNLTFSGFRGDALLRVDGGALVLEKDAAVVNAVGTSATRGGAVVLKAGKATLRPGSRVAGCVAGATAAGGGIWVAGRNCALALEGGAVTGCCAKFGGSGVYAGNGAAVSVGAETTVAGNASADGKADNLYLASPSCVLELASKATGSVGVRWYGGTGNREGDPLAGVGEGVSREDAEASCAAFVNDADGALHAELQEDGAALVWRAEAEDKGEVPPEEAKDLVIYGEGTEAAVTNYYKSFGFALASLTDEAVIVVLGKEPIESDCTVDRKVTVRGAEPGCGLYRAGDCRLVVAPTGDLALEQVTVSGLAPDGALRGQSALVRVEGGSLALGDGAVVCDVQGDGARAAGGVEVWGGVFRMRSGAEIRNCVNAYPKSAAGVPPANVGVGGGLLVDHGTVFLDGGRIAGCGACRAGGAYVGNKSVLYVSGDIEILDNFSTATGKPSNLTVEDLSGLILTGDHTASIGVSDGVRGDTNVFGRVAAEYYAAAGFDALTNSAASFSHDVRYERGVVATNGTDEVLLVWADAFVDKGGVPTFTRLDASGRGEDFYAMGELPPPVPHPVPPPEPKWVVVTNYPGPLAFQAIERTDDARWRLVITNRTPYCNYRLLWTDDLQKGFVSTGAWEHAVGDAAEAVWTTNAVASGDACFWRAEGAEGTNMVLKVEE